MIQIQMQHGRCEMEMEMEIWGDVSVPWKFVPRAERGDKGWTGSPALSYAPIRTKCCDRPSPQVHTNDSVHITHSTNSLHHSLDHSRLTPHA